MSFLLGLIAFFGAAALADEVLKRTSLVRLEVPAGRTIMGGWVLVFFVGTGLSALTFAVLPLINAHVAMSTGGDYPVVLGSAGFFVIVSLLVGWWWRRTHWKWDDQGISSFQGKSETRLNWSDIREAHVSSWISKVSDNYGREIVWTRYTVGYDVLVASLRMHRADLAG
jgi:hypothetical protein